MEILFSLLDDSIDIFNADDLDAIYYNSFGEFEYLINKCKVFEEISKNKSPKWNLVYLIYNYYDKINYIKHDIG
jgi:hypothetical protein